MHNRKQRKVMNDKFLELMNYYLPNWKQLKMELNNQPVSHSEWEY